MCTPNVPALPLLAPSAGEGCSSISVTLYPPRANSRAVATPEMPPPTTTTLPPGGSGLSLGLAAKLRCSNPVAATGNEAAAAAAKADASKVTQRTPTRRSLTAAGAHLIASPHPSGLDMGRAIK
eukprot:Hpha_TRINITY_DN19103_c0_g1::TRINITY_DN19103_c0_g1_i1::g.94790::m.94790